MSAATAAKKKAQLGMDAATASNRLVKDVMFSMVEKSGENHCFHCGEPMTRQNFSIEHKEAWLDSDDPVAKFFDLENVGFSHILCNIGAARKVKSACGTTSRYRAGCRCDECKTAQANDDKMRSGVKNAARIKRRAAQKLLPVAA